MRLLLPLLLLLGSVTGAFAQAKQTISGYVREKGSGELLIGVSVFQNGTSVGTSSNTTIRGRCAGAGKGAMQPFDHFQWEYQELRLPLLDKLKNESRLQPQRIKEIVPG